MQNLIERYFKDAQGQNTFYPPARAGEIIALQAELDFILPEDYKKFLATTNGFEGFIGKFYAIFDPADGVAAATYDSCTDYYPWAICIGSNGNLEMLVLDRRTNPTAYGLLPFIGDDDDFVPLGNTFEAFVERLHNGSVFER